MTETVIRRTLDNGIPVVMEVLPQLRSASLGLWVNTGSRDETPGEHGISHFLEHTFFKGTATRSAEDIAQETDDLGGEMNAFTGREQTALYTKVLSDRVPQAADLLLDVFTASTFDPAQLDRERQVVIEEIRMVEDEPEEWVHDLHTAHMWGESSPLGRSILGTEASVAALDRDAIRAYLARRYTPERIVVGAAGNLDPDTLFDQVNRALGRLEADVSPPAPAADVAAFTGAGPELHHRKLEQVHLCVGGRGLPHCHPDRFGLYVLNDLLGGGSSSRLFQEIREKRGLAYSVYSGIGTYRDCGEITIYAGCSPQSVEEVGELIRREMDRLCREPVEGKELSRIKGHLKGMLVLGLESTFNRMSRLAQDEIYWHGPRPLEELLSGIDAVDADQVLRLARHAFENGPICTTVLGPLPALPPDLAVPTSVAG